MSTPLVSVVVATYNAKKLLKDALNALLNEDFDKNKYEIIVVDDGSKDGTDVFMKDFVKDKLNIHYIRQTNKGVAGARNTGIKLAKGEVVAFTDQDCLADKNWLKEIVKSFEDKEIVGICGKVISEPKKINPFAHYVIDESATGFISCNAAYKKWVLDKLNGFDTVFKYGFDDTDLYMRAEKLGKVTGNKDAVVCHRVIPWSFIQFVKRMRIEFTGQVRFCKKYPNIFKHRDPILSTIWIRGIKYFFYRALGEKRWLFKNPLIYASFIFALISQRYYLLCLCIVNKDAK